MVCTALVTLKLLCAIFKTLLHLCRCWIGDGFQTSYFRDELWSSKHDHELLKLLIVISRPLLGNIFTTATSYKVKKWTILRKTFVLVLNVAIDGMDKIICRTATNIKAEGSNFG